MNLGKVNEHRSWLISAGIAVIITLWLLSGQIGGDDAESVAERPQERTIEELQNRVRVRTQTAEEVTRTITVNGKTEPARTVHLAAETDGRVERTVADRGANMRRGGVIVMLDERDRSARLSQAEATLKQRQVEYDARQKLKGESYVSEAQLQEAVALLEAAKAEVTRAQLDLSYRAVRAPFDGALLSRAVEVGDFVKVGDPIATFVDNRTIVVSANVSEFDAAYIEVGNTAQARLATGEEVTGQVRFVAPVADEATRTFAVELEVDNNNGELRAGGTAELFLPAETVVAHRITPALLTLDDDGNVGVKIINDDGAVEFVVADIALSSNDGVWVSGLPDTTTFITVGQGFVTTGAVVEAIPEDDIPTAVARKGANESE
ncbi:MAG: efflux RND transporter periplasmic adaptor subunit [Pseudomonadota bacterium]